MSGSLLNVLADPAIDPTSGRGPEWGKAAPVALLIIVLMGIALFLLIKSMNRQLRKVPAEFHGGTADPAATAATGAEQPDRSAPDRDQPAPG